MAQLHSQQMMLPIVTCCIQKEKKKKKEKEKKEEKEEEEEKEKKERFVNLIYRLAPPMGCKEKQNEFWVCLEDLV